MTQSPLHILIAAQTQALTALANQVARDGNQRLGQQIAIHAAQLACLETTAQRLAAELATTQAELRGSRAARQQAEATVRHLTAELLEEQDLAGTTLPPPSPARQATIDAIKAGLPRLLK